MPPVPGVHPLSPCKQLVEWVVAEAQEFDFIILSGDIISLNAEEVILELVICRAGLGGWLIVSDSPSARAGVCGGGGGGHHKQRHFLS
jgi:hypothetical protein